MRTIVQITPCCPPHPGGLECVVQHLCAQVGQRHRVQVVTTMLGATGAPPLVRVDRVSVRRHRPVEVARTTAAPGMVRSLLGAPRDAVLHLHCAHALLPGLVALTARLQGRRFLPHLHLDVDASGRLLPACKEHSFSRVVRAAAGVVVLTDARADFVAVTYRVFAEQVFMVSDRGGDEYPVPVRIRAGRPDPEPDPVRLLFVGRLSLPTNVGRLLDALTLVRRPVSLRIVGDGELRDRLGAQVARLGLERVAFCGGLFGADLVDACRQADAPLLPADKEGMLLEAMAAALPVLATDVPGTRELLGGVGLLAAPRAMVLAAAIDSLAADPALRRRLAESCAAASAGYSWDAVARRMEQVHTGVLG